MKTHAAILAVALAAGSAAALASGEWTHELSHRRSSSTSLSISEPEGFKVAVSVGKEVKEDTIPAVFNLANEDAFIPVKVTDKEGESWSKKIEVRARHQAVLKVRFKPAAKGEPVKDGPRRTFIGSVVNASNRCKRRGERNDYRFDLLREGAKRYEFVVPMGKVRENAEVEEGSYDVRVFYKRGDEFIFWQTTRSSVSKDGWKLQLGC